MLGLQTQMSDGTGGDFMPLMIYQAKAGRLYRRDRIGGAAGFENIDTELPAGTRFVWDFGAIQVGWAFFAPGQAPSWAMVPLGQPMPAAPSKDHRQGFRAFLYGTFGSSEARHIREFATTAKTVLGSVDELHSAFEAAPEAATGKVPVVEYAGADPIKTTNAHGVQTNFRPRFTIVQWIDRPADLGERTVPAPNVHLSHHATVAAPKPNGKPVVNAHPAQQANSRHVPPPSKAVQDEWDAPANAGSMVLPPVGSTIEDDIPF